MENPSFKDDFILIITEKNGYLSQLSKYRVLYKKRFKIDGYVRNFEGEKLYTNDNKIRRL